MGDAPVESPAICHDGERRNKSKVRFMMGTLFSVTAALPVIICEGIALEHGLFDENLPMTAWSITMVKQGKQHIEEWWLERWLKFLRTYCCMGAFALEVGDKEEHLHIQGAVVVHAASDASAKAAFDRFLKWFLDIPAGQKDGDKGYKLQVKPCNKGAGQTIMYVHDRLCTEAAVTRGESLQVHMLGGFTSRSSTRCSCLCSRQARCLRRQNSHNAQEHDVTYLQVLV